MTKISVETSATTNNTPWLVFSTTGEIDLRVLTTMGVSVKPNTDSPIGQFGTGFKMALAVIARLGGHVMITRGKECYVLASQTVNIRGKDFELLVLRNSGETVSETVGETVGEKVIELPFTTELAKRWKPWMAFRELWSNMLDEAGLAAVQNGPEFAEDGWTHISVQCDEVFQAYQKRDEIFISGSPIWENDMMALYEGQSNRIYYRGISVGMLDKPSRWTWNIKGEMSLTEDRTLDSYSSKWAIQQMLMESPPPQLGELLTLDNTWWEHGLDFDNWLTPAPEFVSTVERLHARKLGTINRSAWKKCRNMLPNAEPERAQIAEHEREMLGMALATVRAIGLMADINVEVVKSLGDERLIGLAQRMPQKIWLAKSLLGKGQRLLTTTLLEEFLHAEAGLADYSRGLQDWLLDKVVELHEALEEQQSGAGNRE